MNKRANIWLAACMIASLLLTPATLQAQADPMSHCRDGAFSTEEDFVMLKSEPADGDPYISDGDMLSLDGQVCARNRDLLQAFNPAGAYMPDLGLDALDLADPEERLIAFSTELDDPQGRFSEGDLLFTNGAVIPNFALVHQFGIDHDIGLDAVQLLGERDRIRRFIFVLSQSSREELIAQPGKLLELLQEYELDIWFSTEGTSNAGKEQQVLDGDLLSPFGVVVQRNDQLLAAPIPAGIPDRGVDFGLDAVQAGRTTEAEGALATLQFSTELLFTDMKFPFTDGDVLEVGGGVSIKQADLIVKFAPAADFLGLDALSGARARQLPEPEPMITEIGYKSVWDINGGFVPINGGGTGLYWEGLAMGTPQAPPRPFGWHIPVDGYLSDAIYEWRIAFRNAGDPAPAPGSAPAIKTTWSVDEWYAIAPHCRPTGSFASDPVDGWFKKSDYDFYRSGVGGCPNGGLILAVWDALNDPNVVDKDGHYVIWMEWREAPAGPILREPVDPHVQMDNTAPVINSFELRTPDGSVVEPCGGAGAGENILHVYADISDEYYGGYRVRVAGGNPPAAVGYGWHNYWDGTLEVANTDNHGTTPGGSLQFLRTINMADLGASYTECCYVLDIWASDVAIRHNFNSELAYPAQPGWAWPSKFLTFAAAP